MGTMLYRFVVILGSFSTTMHDSFVVYIIIVQSMTLFGSVLFILRIGILKMLQSIQFSNTFPSHFAAFSAFGLVCLLVAVCIPTLS